ncbi:hypothetical protein D3C80_1121510 [compost metagenome]
MRTSIYVPVIGEYGCRCRPGKAIVSRYHFGNITDIICILSVKYVQASLLIGQQTQVTAIAYKRIDYSFFTEGTIGAGHQAQITLMWLIRNIL